MAFVNGRGERSGGFAQSVNYILPTNSSTWIWGFQKGHDPGAQYLFHFNDHLNRDYVHEAAGVSRGPDISDYSQSEP